MLLARAWRWLSLAARKRLEPVMGPLGRQVPGLERRRSERVGVTAHEHRDHHFGLDAQALLERVTDAALRAIPAWTASRATATAKCSAPRTPSSTPATKRSGRQSSTGRASTGTPKARSSDLRGCLGARSQRPSRRPSALAPIRSVERLSYARRAPRRIAFTSARLARRRPGRPALRAS